MRSYVFLDDSYCYDKSVMPVVIDAVIEAVSEVFSGADSHFRSYASGVFRRIHSDLPVKRALEFLEKEEDCEIRCLSLKTK